MKKNLLLIALLFVSQFAIAQQTEETVYYRPLQGNKTISFNIVGLATMALNLSNDPINNAQLFDVRYFWKDDVAFRLGLGINNSTTTITSKTDPKTFPVSETENKDENSGFSIGLGAEKHIKTKSRSLDPYAGGGIFFSSLGKNTVTAKNKTTQSNGDVDEHNIKTVNPGGSLIAIALNGGFFWYFTQNLALGAEISLGYGTGSTGGDKTVTTTMIDNGTTTTTEVKTNDETKFSGMRTFNTGNIHLLIKF